jgi:hypothetical protein
MGVVSGVDAGARGVSPGGATDAGGATGLCNAPAPKVLASGHTLVHDLFASGPDLYFIEIPDGGSATVIRHVKDDGTDEGMVYASPEYPYEVQSIWATSDAIYFVEADSQGNAAAFRIPRGGGDKVKLSKDYSAGSAEIGGVDSSAVYVSMAVDGNYELHRVPISGGSETVVASLKGLAFRDMQIMGSDMWFLANDGLDGYYKVSLSMPGAAPVQVSPEPCSLEAAVTSAGVYCSDALALNRMPLGGGDYTKVLDLPEGPVDVSTPDGDVIYLVPKSTPDNPGTLRKFPVVGGKPTDISCGRGTMTIPVFDDNGVYWLEEDTTDSTKTNVYAASKR